ncbi:MAG TPA: type II toxin-antitoxin system VapC family toxin [Candidatus Acidoferrales bacterium]|nr:type II toxin-antitoxin system VapC family toxin [Candidatus Acidoferrales bacterium]
MTILDTIVLSAMMQAKSDEHVVAWLDKQPRTSLWTTSVSIFEIQSGLQLLPAGRRRSFLTKTFEDVVRDDIGGRVAPFDTVAAQHSAGLVASRHKKGRPVELRDTMIAGIVLACNATLATRNVAHFEDLPVRVINPWAV